MGAPIGFCSLFWTKLLCLVSFTLRMKSMKLLLFLVIYTVVIFRFLRWLRNVWHEVSQITAFSECNPTSPSRTVDQQSSMSSPPPPVVLDPLGKKEDTPSVKIVVAAPHPRHKRSYLPSWTQFTIISALVGILSVVLVYLPCMFLRRVSGNK